MSEIPGARSRPRDLVLTPGWFAVFMALQAVVLAGSLLWSPAFFLLLGLAVLGLLYAVGVLLSPWLLIPLLLFSTGLDSAARLGESAGPRFHLTAFHVCFILMLIAIAINAFLRRRTRFPRFELTLPLAFFLGSVALSLTYTPNHPEATISFVRLSCLVAFAYMAQVIVDSRRAVSAVIWCMALMTIFGAAMGGYQVITGRFHLPVKVIEALGGNVPRATATFQNPNIFAEFLLDGFLPTLAVLLNMRTAPFKKIIYLLAVVAGAAGLLASFSRSSWLAAMIGVMVVLWLSGKLRYFFMVALSGVIGVLALKEFVPFAAYIFERFTSIFDVVERFGYVGTASGTARVYLVIAALFIFLDHPLLGVGWRGFPMVFPAYAPVGYPHWTHVKESHTFFAMILAELGLIGFVAFCWFVLRTLRRGIAAVPRMQDPFLRAVLIGLVAAFVAAQVSQSFNGTHAENMFWFYIGMLYAVIHLDEESRSAAGA
ncbi:MAG: O-antigen ligase family protein [Candidatus Latescibacterota bacterium]|jgi:O-antigen ligase